MTTNKRIAVNNASARLAICLSFFFLIYIVQTLFGMIKICRLNPELEKFGIVILAINASDATTGYCSSIKSKKCLAKPLLCVKQFLAVIFCSKLSIDTATLLCRLTISN